MKLKNQFIDFYIKSSLHVGFAVFALTQITRQNYSIPIHFLVDFFIFFGTVVAYNSFKYSHLININFLRQKRYLAITFITVASSFFMLFLLMNLDRNDIIAFLKIGFIVLLYPLLRKYYFLKMLYVSFCITYITVYIPIISNQHDIFFSIQQFLMIFCLLIPFEIVDIEQDSKNLKTLPQKIGVSNTKIFGYLLLITYLILEIYKDKTSLIDLFIAIVIGLFIFYAKPNRKLYYTSFWVESIPIFWWILNFI